MLVGADAHSVAGIMHRELLWKEWAEGAQGRLGFTRNQTVQIRQWIIKRTGRHGDVFFDPSNQRILVAVAGRH